jgi:long-chain acyl-CoA synthetase
MANRVRAFGRALIDLGFPEGSVLTILSQNRIEWVVSLLAAQTSGGAGAGIYDTCSVEEVAYINRHSRAPITVVENRSQWQKVFEGRSQAPDLHSVVVIDADGVPLGEDDGLETWAFDDLVRRGRSLPTEALDQRIESIRGDRPASLIYTSGTTGLPKGVVLTHDNLAHAAPASYRALDGEDDFVVLSYLPLSHIAEQMISVYGPVICGYTVYIAESREAVVDNLQEVRPRFLFGVPRVWEKFRARMEPRLEQASGAMGLLIRWAREVARKAAPLRCRDARGNPWLELQYRVARALVFDRLKKRVGLDRCRVFASGGAPISREALDFFQSVDICIREAYGISEAAGLCTANPKGDVRLGSVGPAIDGVEIRIAEDGEVLLRGPNIFVAYFNDEEGTREAIDEDGWFHSGDVGRLDDDGYLYITDRKKNIIITSGGKNVSPQLVEGKLKGLPLVDEAVVIGDARKYLVALIALDEEAAQKVLTEAGRRDAMAHEDPAIREALEAGVKRVNDSLARVEQIKRFAILPHGLSQETGEITPTMKLRRNVIEARHGDLIEDLYRP